jgi:hypothetical protein
VLPRSDYPCEDLDLVTACDWAWGAGTVFPAGPLHREQALPDRRRSPLPREGADGPGRDLRVHRERRDQRWKSLGQALTAAVQKPINDPGGCNAGFLREDALLMVTTIATNLDEPSDSEGTPAEWAQAVIDAKARRRKSVVMFNILGGTECLPYDRICQMAKMFTYHHHHRRPSPTTARGSSRPRASSRRRAPGSCRRAECPGGRHTPASAADDRERGVVRGADAPGVDLAEGAHGHRERAGGPCLSIGVKVHSGS